MIDRELVAMAVAEMAPEAADLAEREARARGVTVADVVLEENLAVHGAVSEQLYALRHHQPSLEVLEGGRA